MTDTMTPRHAKQRLAAAVTCALATGFAITFASVTPAAADLPECGTTVTYGDWVNKGVTSSREWTWRYYNCSKTTAHRSVDVAGGPDSDCFAIAYKTQRTVTRNEVRPPHVNYYRTTKSC